ncbi:IclR family transcriptional regulator [Streptomyces syringium]|uniref:IclR family transcriptional regulator n=1 Tax=Streptomyces syringium TaxID=76729 RepID=UPI003D8C0227
MSDSSQDSDGSRGKFASMQKGYRLQAVFMTLGGEVHSLKEITEAFGAKNQSTAHSWLQAGCMNGIFEQVSRGMYRLGPEAARLGMRTLLRTPDPEATQMVLRELCRVTGGVAGYFVARGDSRICKLHVLGDHSPASFNIDSLVMVRVLGSLRTGASGRVMLAHLDSYTQESVLAEAVPNGAGPGAIRSNAELVSTFADIQRRGYAIGRQEAMSGWDAVAAPVMWGARIQGSVAAALPVDRMPTDPRPVIEATVKAAAQLSLLVSAA